MSEDDPKVRRVIEAGRELGVEVKPHFFSAGTRTAQDAAREVGCDVAQIVKTLVFMGDGSPMLFFVSGANRLDEHKAARAAGVSGLTKADANEAKDATGFSIGATPPFGHATRLRIFMDEDLLAHDEVWAAGGRPDSVFPVEPAALQKATAAEVVELKES
jgi:Cys-tRNA(Pro) deacylase